MASWDSPVVSAPGTASYAVPLVNFDDIRSAPQTYYKGQTMAREEEKANLFRNGIPRVGGGDTGPIDVDKVMTNMARVGGYEYAAPLINLQVQSQQGQAGQQAIDRAESIASGGGSPASGSPAYAAPVAAPRQGQPVATTSAPQGPSTAKPATVMTILAAQGIPNDQLQAAADAVARQLGVGVTDPINTRDPAVANVLGPAIVWLKKNRIGEVVQSGAPATAAQAAPASAPGEPVSTPAQRIAQGAEDAAAYFNMNTAANKEKAAAYLNGEAARNSQINPKLAEMQRKRAEDYFTQAKQIRDYLGDEDKSTDAMKDFNAFRLPGETIDQYKARVAGAVSRAELTPEQKVYLTDRQPGESQAQYQARAAGLKKAAEAPYEIATAAVRESGRPIAIHPNEVVTTGNAANPALGVITDWAVGKLGPNGQPIASQPPGSPAPAVPPSPPPVPPHGVPSGGSPTVPEQRTDGGVTGQSAFTPRVVRNPDGSLASSVTPSTEKLQSTAATDFDKAHESYNASQPVQMQLATLENAFRDLNQSNWSHQGTGANVRAELGKAVNSMWSLAGVKDQDLPFDPNKIGSWETATKESTRLGFALARTLGAREAMQIVQGAIKANPSVENTPIGAKMVVNTIRENSQRDIDRYEFLTNWAQTHGGDLIGADVAFNKANPPALYARRAIIQAQRDIPQDAISALRANPSMAKDFDTHFGQPGLAQLFIGGTR